MNYKSRIVLAMLLAMLGISKPVLANMDKAEHAEHIQTMRQAATELKSTDPALSDKLNGYADQKEKWASKKDEYENQKQEDAGKLRAAATALQSTRKDLSDDLNAMADRCLKWTKEGDTKPS